MATKRKHAYLSEDKKCLVKDVFRLMDRNGDGYLDYYETKAAMRAMGLTVKKSFIKSVMRLFDCRDSNRICFEDFYYIVTEKLSTQNLTDEAKYAYKLFTAECASDRITLKTLQQINDKVKSHLTVEELEYMINEFDLDGDGSIDENEFLEIMTGQQSDEESY